jgi:hypothetical protein
MTTEKLKTDKLIRFKGEYKPPLIDTLSMRSGSMDILQAPSRISKTLFYPNGKVIKGVDIERDKR